MENEPEACIQQPQVINRLEIFDESISNLEGLIQTLDNRLIPVSRQSTPKSEVEVAKNSQEELVEIAQIINDQNRRVCNYIEILQNILNRLEI